MSRKFKKARELGKQHGLEWAVTARPGTRMAAAYGYPEQAKKDAMIRLILSCKDPVLKCLGLTLGAQRETEVGQAQDAYEGAWHDAVLGIVQAEHIQFAQELVNGGRGVTCVRSMADYLRLGDRASALAVWFNDGDKVQQYLELYKTVVETLGCRLHATKACQERLCSEKS